MAKRTATIAHPGTMAASTPGRVWLAFPLALAAVLAAFRFLPTAQANPRLGLSILGASLSLAALCGVVWYMARGRALKVEVQLRAQHYLQACAQGTVLVYWGWYWPPVYDAAPLIAAQLVFAYAFDMLLAWSRRDTYTLGFAPVPGDLQHQPVPVVQARLVLPAVPDDRGRVCRQGADSLGAGTDGACTSSIPRRFRWRCSRSA